MGIPSITTLIRAVFLCLLLAGGSLWAEGQPKTPPAPAAASNLDAVKQFRSAYPYPMQAVAVQRINAGDLLLIVAEPPPHVTKGDLQAVLPGVEFIRSPIGADGWVTDAVVRLKRTDKELEELIGELHQLLYGTAYKAFTLDISAKSDPNAKRPSLDLQLAANDVLSWVVTGEKAVKFRPLIGGDTVGFTQIKESDSLVYHSEPEGLVGWWIPKNVKVSDCTVPVRQFAVDSDLILGAAGDDRGVLIIGRKRVAPYEILPPLRTESILLLAGINKLELMQTINPQLFSASINTNPSERWELNLLSPELYDAELGTLLTISDVLLKSWTEHGLNQVRGFDDYPKPKTYPFKQAPITFGADSLVFNYNSLAAGSLLEVKKGTSILSTVRTGVLPISYLPDGQAAKGKQAETLLNAEKTAYAWFAAQNDPHLVRVVQYTTLFQAFHAFKVQSAPARGAGNKDVVMEEQRVATREMFEKVSKLKDNEVKTLVKRMDECPESAVVREEIATLQKEKKITDAEAKEFLKFLSPEQFEKFLGDVRKLQASDREKMVALLIGTDATRLRGELETVAMICRILGSAERLDEVLAKRLSDKSRGWLHSPVLIYDHNSGAFAVMVGGHNWTPQTPRLRLDPEMPKGQTPKREPDGSYRIHPDDLQNLAVQGRGQAPLFTGRREPQSMTTTLGSQETYKPKLQYGWQRSSVPPSKDEQAQVQKIRESRKDAVCVFAQPDGSYRVVTPRGEFEARTHKELIDTLLDTNITKTVDAQLFGVNVDQAYAVHTSLMARRKGMDRIVALKIPHTKPIPDRPETFDPAKYEAGKDVIKSYEISEGKGTFRLELPPAKAGAPTTRVNVVVRASEKVLKFLEGAFDQFLGVIQRAFGKSKTTEEFHANFQDEFRKTFKGLLNGELEDLRIETQYLLRVEDQYLSRGLGDESGSVG